jgi:hypothetical protein
MEGQARDWSNTLTEESLVETKRQRSPERERERDKERKKRQRNLVVANEAQLLAHGPVR